MLRLAMKQEPQIGASPGVQTMRRMASVCESDKRAALVSHTPKSQGLQGNACREQPVA